MSSLIIGITGGIGAGKSVVSQYLAKLGEKVICADKVARQVVLPGKPGNAAIRRTFGDAYFYSNGSVNRKKLAKEVFSDKQKLETLNDLLHPIIVKSMFDHAETLRGRVFMDAALLIQTNMHKKMNYVWLIVAEQERRILRVMKRDGLKYDQIKRRMSHQMSENKMRAFADEIIENNRQPEVLYKKIDDLLSRPKYMR